ncbi:MAG: caspase family protein [Synechococcales cyanobacterium RU_4_20]|nr:caspase family protein [Synechococcales cyanobacterium RU_4_20]
MEAQVRLRPPTNRVDPRAVRYWMTSEAIVIGVNNYEFLQSLSCARQDAWAMKTFLEREVGFDRVYYFAEDALAVNGVSMKPTRNNLRRVMRDTFAKPFMGDGDNFLVLF